MCPFLAEDTEGHLCLYCLLEAFVCTNDSPICPKPRPCWTCALAECVLAVKQMPNHGALAKTEGEMWAAQGAFCEPLCISPAFCRPSHMAQACVAQHGCSGFSPHICILTSKVEEREGECKLSIIDSS